MVFSGFRSFDEFREQDGAHEIPFRVIALAFNRADLLARPGCGGERLPADEGIFRLHGLYDFGTEVFSGRRLHCLRVFDAPVEHPERQGRERDGALTGFHLHVEGRGGFRQDLPGSQPFRDEHFPSGHICLDVEVLQPLVGD